MGLVAALLVACLTGFSVSAAAGNFAVWRTGVPAGFSPPFVTHRHILRSLLVTAVAGPFLVLGEARRRAGGGAGFAAPILTLLAAGWALALGVVILGASEHFLRAVA